LQFSFEMMHILNDSSDGQCRSVYLARCRGNHVVPKQKVPLY